MNKVLLFLSALSVTAVAVSSCQKSTDDKTHPAPGIVKVAETDPAILTPVHKLINGNIKGFYEAVPAHYHETDETYPVLLCFHGGGQYGEGDTALLKILTDGIPKRFSDKTFPPTFTSNGEHFSFIMIAPQFSREPFVPDLVDLINYVKANYRVDAARIYLSGFSLGAKKLTDYAAAYPATVAAITAMGGAMNITDDYDARVKSIADAKLPVWQFHNVDIMSLKDLFRLTTVSARQYRRG
jgi:poly(3-hydroxybutyrate) depolymerase